MHPGTAFRFRMVWCKYSPGQKIRYNEIYRLNELYIRNRVCAEKGRERHVKIILVNSKLKISKRI